MVFGPNKEYIYFTDPPYGLVETFNKIDISNNKKSYVDTKRSKLGFSGIYRVSIRGEKYKKMGVQLLDKSLHRPNGIIFSHNFKELYISNCINGQIDINIFKFDIKNKKNIIKFDKKLNEKQLLKKSNKKTSKLITCCNV